MACVCKHYDWETLQGLNEAAPSDYPDHSSVRHSITLAKVVDYENHQVPNRNQSNHTGILERIEATKERKRNNNKPVIVSNRGRQPREAYLHEHCDPEMSVDKKWDSVSILIEASDDTRHQISDNDQIAHSNTKTFNGNCGIEYNRSIRVGDL